MDQIIEKEQKHQKHVKKLERDRDIDFEEKKKFREEKMTKTRDSLKYGNRAKIEAV